MEWKKTSPQSRCSSLEVGMEWSVRLLLSWVQFLCDLHWQACGALLLGTIELCGVVEMEWEDLTPLLPVMQPSGEWLAQQHGMPWGGQRKGWKKGMNDDMAVVWVFRDVPGSEICTSTMSTHVVGKGNLYLHRSRVVGTHVHGYLSCDKSHSWVTHGPITH